MRTQTTTQNQQRTTAETIATTINKLEAMRAQNETTARIELPSTRAAMICALSSQLRRFILTIMLELIVICQ